MPNNFSLVKKGYDPYEVDDFIDKMKAMLKNYKEKEDAINNAIVSAQKAADEIVSNAKVEAQNIIGDAQNKIVQMKNLLAMQKNIIDSFSSDYNQLVNKYLIRLDDSDTFKMYSKINSIGDKINNLVETRDFSQMNSDDQESSDS